MNVGQTKQFENHHGNRIYSLKAHVDVYAAHLSASLRHVFVLAYNLEKVLNLRLAAGC